MRSKQVKQAYRDLCFVKTFNSFRWRFIVWHLARSAILARLHTIPPGLRTCSFISHLNSSGSIQPGCPLQHTELLKYISLHCPTRYPLTPGSRKCTCGQSALHRSTMSEHTQHSWGSNSRSLTCNSHMLPLSHNAPKFSSSGY